MEFTVYMLVGLLVMNVIFWLSVSKTGMAAECAISCLMMWVVWPMAVVAFVVSSIRWKREHK